MRCLHRHDVRSRSQASTQACPLGVTLVTAQAARKELYDRAQTRGATPVTPVAYALVIAFVILTGLVCLIWFRTIFGIWVSLLLVGLVTPFVMAYPGPCGAVMAFAALYYYCRRCQYTLAWTGLGVVVLVGLGCLVDIVRSFQW